MVEKKKSISVPLYVFPLAILLVAVLVISTFLVFFNPNASRSYYSLDNVPGGTLPDLIQMNETPIYRITDFSLPGIDGKNHALSEFKGKIVVLDLMATWCEPCKEVYRVIHEVLPMFPDVGFLTISVSPSTDDLNNLRSYAREQDITWPLLLDGDLIVANQTETYYIPHVMVVKILERPDDDSFWGYVHYSAIGAPTVDNLVEAINFTKSLYDTNTTMVESLLETS